MQHTNNRSNRDIFIPRDSGSPKNGLFSHISSLGQIARLDFERFDVAGETIFKIEGDAFPTSQEDEEARIASLAYAIRKLGNEIDAAEFIRCLNAICEDGDARSRQTIASHYYREISERGVNVVLKAMAILAMQLAPTVVVEEEEKVVTFTTAGENTSDEPSDFKENVKQQPGLFDQELASVLKMVSGSRRVFSCHPDEFESFLDQMISDGFDGEDLASRIESYENLCQYDESGAIIVMSAHERTIACGQIDSELTAEDLPAKAGYLAADLRRAYVNGKPIDEIWEEIDSQLEFIFPVVINLDGPKGLFPANLTTGQSDRVSIYRSPRFISHANRELQLFSRAVLETILSECQSDFHLTALRSCKVYREFHKAVRGSSDTKELGKIMKKAYEAREKIS